ncbi:MAG: bifunctional folylpolyglutamate synthase/dihydrofolate synthase [Clostridiales bacterium]|nr:bifunctional folylpolyglutamate synthase/dihydrofolate synthase [Clostridiales bacterium]
MNAEQVIEAIHGSYLKGSKHGLRNTQMLLERLCPQCRVPVIHVAGTNGKGSTCAMLESILRAAGYRTGLYTSPFLQMYHERIRLDGLPLTDDLMVKYGNPLVEAAYALEAEDVQVTPFEMGTVLALTAFEGEQVDVAIIEVGLGGRLDPTNVVSPCLCAITAIGLDHMNLLGNTLTEIAGEKAGIIKPGVPVVCQPAAEEVAAVFAEKAAEMHAPLIQLEMSMVTAAHADAYGSVISCQLQNTWEQVNIPLPGAHQQKNALTVLALVEQLRQQGWNIPDKAVVDGISATRWLARLEWCGNVLIDGAHNPQGIEALRDYVQAYLPDKRRILLTGVLEDKLQPDMLKMLADVGEKQVTVTPDTPRAMAAQELAQRLNHIGGAARAADSLASGLAIARELAGEDGVVIAAGSLYFAGGLRNVLGLPWR